MSGIAVSRTRLTGRMVMLRQALYASGYVPTSQSDPPSVSRKYSYSRCTSCPLMNHPRSEFSSSSAAEAAYSPVSRTGTG